MDAWMDAWEDGLTLQATARGRHGNTATAPTTGSYEYRYLGRRAPTASLGRRPSALPRAAAGHSHPATRPCARAAPLAAWGPRPANLAPGARKTRRGCNWLRCTALDPRAVRAQRAELGPR